MNIYRTPSIIKTIFPGLVWDFRNNGKNIYLTFDDGPNPGITEYVLDVLEKFNARATFFCVGEVASCYQACSAGMSCVSARPKK